MNILLAIHHELDPNAGAPGSIMQLRQAYQNLGHTAQCYGFDDLPTWVPNMATGLLFPELLAAHLIRDCSNQALDVVDASTGDAWVWGSFFKSGSRNRPLLVTHSHGLEHIAHLELLEEARLGKIHLSWKYPLYRGGYRLWEVAQSLRCADVIFMLNQRDANYAVETLQIPAERIHIVGNGIPDTFLNLPFEPGATSSDAPLSIALIGTYIPRKGIHYSTPALNEILSQYPQIKVSLLGTGFTEEQIYAEFDPAIRDRILIFPRYTHAHLPRLLQTHQVLLFPSLSEGFGLAILEAMACGLAPVATNIPGPTEFVVDQENGMLIPPRSTKEIVQALEHIIHHRAYLEQLRRKAYTTAQSYSWTHIAQQRLAIYEKALERRKL
jgi:glycosyltransferase involved in cell wall biosynthesis